jgi:hypothetical protein
VDEDYLYNANHTIILSVSKRRICLPMQHTKSVNSLSVSGLCALHYRSRSTQLQNTRALAHAHDLFKNPCYSTLSPQSNPVAIQTATAAALATSSFCILELVRTEPRLVFIFLLKKSTSFATLYSVIYLMSHSRILGSAKPWYSCTIWSTFQPAIWRMTAAAQPVRCYKQSAMVMQTMTVRRTLP